MKKRGKISNNDSNSSLPSDQDVVTLSADEDLTNLAYWLQCKQISDRDQDGDKGGEDGITMNDRLKNQLTWLVYKFLAQSFVIICIQLLIVVSVTNDWFNT